MNVQPPSLFRQEAIEAKQERLHGEVIIKQTLPAVIVTGVLVAVILIAGLWIALGSYARTEQVRGILGTTQSSSKIIVNRPGIITKLNVVDVFPVSAYAAK